MEQALTEADPLRWWEGGRPSRKKMVSGKCDKGDGSVVSIQDAQSKGQGVSLGMRGLRGDPILSKRS